MSSGPKLYQLHDRLWVRGHTLGIAPERMVRAVHDRGIRLVVCVALRPDHGFAQAAAVLGVQYRHEPMSDGRDVPVTRVTRIVDDVVRAMGQYGVLVHCDAGRNRSLLVAVLALARVTGVPLADALQAVRQVRPAALANRHFERFVLEHAGVSIHATLF